MTDRDEFKFPDEVEKAENSVGAEAEDSIEVQIEDDTPAQDRDPVTGKMREPMPKQIVEELENDTLDEYSEKVKQRLSQMKKVWHDERRAKEAAIREREEALKFAQLRDEEVRQLRQRVGNSEKALIAEAVKATNNQLAISKDKFRQAYESGDPDKITEAQQEMTAATMRLRELERYKPQPLQKEDSGVENNQQTQAPPRSAPQVDTKADTWRQQNPWFGPNKGMTAFALGLHEELVNDEGLDPSSDEYYDRINRTMRRRFPDYFQETAEQTSEAAPRKEEKPRAQKAANVVAPATRSTAPRQVRLTPSQVAIAKKLGLSNEQYAREMMKLETN
jgi:hypothetical protein